MRLVIDTNVLVSGLLKPKGPPGRILDSLVQGTIVAVYSPAILAEYGTVLARRKFAFDPENVAALLELVVAEGWPISRIARLDMHLRDPGDRPFYECAAAAGCPLVTGNAKDFPIKGPVEILSPAQLARRLGV
ncbi:MAG TPA: putative toxin-antitoxin system toxin component, PIN family [Acidiferrobacterales bacterium]|nr:putative toxin-antitoxin system toxin component, PIN family [Acidiferrobacterales bacterium]